MLHAILLASADGKVPRNIMMRYRVVVEANINKGHTSPVANLPDLKRRLIENFLNRHDFKGKGKLSYPLEHGPVIFHELVDCLRNIFLIEYLRLTRPCLGSPRITENVLTYIFDRHQQIIGMT